MTTTDSTIAVFSDHAAAEAAIKKLAATGFQLKNLSIVGKGYHTDEKAVGFYNIGERVTFWGTRGAVWGGLWSLFFGGLFLTIPAVGGVIVLGALATIIIGAIEGAVLTGGAGALAAALYSLGVPKDSVVTYEAAIKADGFLVMAHGSAGEIANARAILAMTPAAVIDAHHSSTSGRILEAI
jgi:hypothetical protein